METTNLTLTQEQKERVEKIDAEMEIETTKLINSQLSVAMKISFIFPVAAIIVLIFTVIILA